MKYFALALALALVAVAAAREEIRLISLAPGEAIWMTEGEVLEKLIRANVRFIDITDHRDAAAAAPRKRVAIPDEPTQQATVNALLPLIDMGRVEANLQTFTAFNNRYYTSTTGVESSNWLFNTAKALTSNRSDITVTQFTHTWAQSSVVARVQGTAAGRQDIVVLGAHQDSINGGSPANGRAPGADDDGSGSMSILEVLRVLVAGNYRPAVTVEFQWYAAEEVGLRGSQDIANSYAARGVDVRAMMQLDMDGYDVRQQNIAIVTDYTDAEVNAFQRQLVDEYCDLPWVNTVCGYACSDHASYDRAGYPSSFPFEAQMSAISPYIHTASDTISTVSFDHMREFIKLGVAFAVELGTNN